MPCNCREKINDTLKTGSLRLSDKGSAIQIVGNELVVRYGVPLERFDKKPLQRKDPKMVAMTHCPFCGTEY